MSMYILYLYQHEFLARRSLSAGQSVSVILTELSSIPSVGLCVSVSVCRSPKCTVAKRLNGSGCHLGWWVGSVEDGCIRMMGLLNVEGENSFGGEFGASLCKKWGLCCIVVREWHALPKLLLGDLLLYVQKEQERGFETCKHTNERTQLGLHE